MAARVEEIMQAWETQLKTLIEDVYRLRGRKIPKIADNKEVAYQLFQGSFDPLDDEQQSNPNEYWNINIIIRVIVKTNSPIETALNFHFETIYNLIMESLDTRQLGLSYVHDTYCDGTNEPEDDLEDGRKPVAMMEILFRTKFKQPINSASG